MKHLENIKKFIDSSTFPVLSEELQGLLIKAQHEFLINKIEDILHDALYPYLMEIDDSLSFNVNITKKGEIQVNPIYSDDTTAVSNTQVVKKEEIPTDQSVDKELVLNKNPQIENGKLIGGHSALEVNITDVLEIDRDLLTRGIIVIKPEHYKDIESIMGVRVEYLDDTPIDILFNGKLYEDASLCCIEIGADMFGKTKYYLQLRWSRQSRLAKDIRSLVSPSSITNNDAAGKRYSYFSIRYNYIDAAFQLNVFKEKYHHD